MNIFGSSSKSQTDNYNIGTGASFDANQGDIAYGNQQNTYSTTDHGAVAGGVALGQAALLANNQAVRAALDTSGAMSADAFNFGSRSLDFGSYAIEKMSGFTSEVIANGQRATSEALSFAKNMSVSESANTSELMIKAITVLGIVAVLGFALTRGKK